MIYLDNAATSPVLRVAKQTLSGFLDATGNPNSSHIAGLEARAALEEARKRIARCINAQPDEIHFTASATDACQWAMQTLSENCCLTQVNATEHHAVLDCPVTTNAKLEPRGMAQMLANNETGELYDAPRKGIPRTDLWFCDATAAMGHIPIDVKKLGADYLCAGGHKFGSPCGIGFLYARRGAPLAERRTGTPPVALACAMASALEWHVEHMAENTEHINLLREATISGLLGQMNILRVNSWIINIPPEVEEKHRYFPHIMNVSFDGIDGKALALMCSKRGVMVSAGAACTSGDNAPSHVLMAMYHDEARARSAVRISFSHENTVVEAEQAAKIIAECVTTLREIG